MSQPKKPIDTRRRKKRYSFEEDTHIVAQTAFYLVLSTREDVDPVPFIEAILEGYAERVRTVHASVAPVMPKLPPAIPDPDPDRPVRQLRVRRLSEE
jgi:hypothetical protein